MSQQPAVARVLQNNAFDACFECTDATEMESGVYERQIEQNEKPRQRTGDQADVDRVNRAEQRQAAAAVAGPRVKVIAKKKHDSEEEEEEQDGDKKKKEEQQQQQAGAHGDDDDDGSSSSAASRAVKSATARVPEHYSAANGLAATDQVFDKPFDAAFEIEASADFVKTPPNEEAADTRSRTKGLTMRDCGGSSAPAAAAALVPAAAGDKKKSDENSGAGDGDDDEEQSAAQSQQQQRRPLPAGPIVIGGKEAKVLVAEPFDLAVSVSMGDVLPTEDLAAAAAKE